MNHSRDRLLGSKKMEYTLRGRNEKSRCLRKHDDKSLVKAHAIRERIRLTLAKLSQHPEYITFNEIPEKYCAHLKEFAVWSDYAMLDYMSFTFHDEKYQHRILRINREMRGFLIHSIYHGVKRKRAVFYQQLKLDCEKLHVEQEEMLGLYFYCNVICRMKDMETIQYWLHTRLDL